MADIKPDAETISITIKCLMCGSKFPSPIFMTPYASFDSALLTGNTVTCPSCGQVTGCNKENFVAKFEGGGFLGNDAI